MKRFTYVFQCIALFLCVHAHAAENQSPIIFTDTIPNVTYRMIKLIKAVPNDTNSIVTLIDEQACTDNTRIVVLPEKFRTQAVAEAITNGKFYIAQDTTLNEVVAFKKLFIVSNKEEFDDITNNELRCSGPKRRFVGGCIKTVFKNGISFSATMHENMIPEFSLQNSVVIYFGGDYTAPEYRNKKINSTLTRHAFDTIKKRVIENIRNNNLKNIVLLYGLTKANAGEGVGEIDRTPSIIRAFGAFAQEVATKCDFDPAMLISRSRYEAFMPTFNLEDEECKPLPDDQAIPGYGNVVLYALSENPIR
jgi:hypothetical protein